MCNSSTTARVASPSSCLPYRTQGEVRDHSYLLKRYSVQKEAISRFQRFDSPFILLVAILETWPKLGCARRQEAGYELHRIPEKTCFW